MAESDLRQFYFYQKYVWSPTDFDNFQAWVRGGFEGLGEGAFGDAVLSGLRPSGGGGMTILVNAGIGVNANGRLVVVDSQLNTTVASPVGNPARTLVVLRPTETDGSDIPEPLNPSNQVPLHKFMGYDLIVIDGTPAVTPSYPSKQAGDIIVAGLRLSAGHTTITEADLDWGVVDRPRKRKNKIFKESSSFSVDPEAVDIYELDFASASGVAQLPAASGYEGLSVSFVKIDSSSNELAVSGQGAEVISGQSAQILDTQWQTLEIYSNGTTWRVK